MATDALKSIWYITRKFPPSRGGMQQLSHRIATELGVLRPLTLLRWRAGQWGLPLFVLGSLMRLGWGLMRGQVRVLLLGDPVLSLLALPARWAGVPVAVVVHGLDLTYPNRLYQWYLRSFFRGRMDTYICISRFVFDALIARGVDESRCALIHPGASDSPMLETGGWKDSPPALLILGRLVRRKGALWFVREVMPRVLASRASVRLDIVGDGPERAAIAQAIRDANLDEAVRLWGDVDEANKAQRLAQCDVVLMPNIRVEGDPEGFGLVALEAAMSRRYVVAADLEGLRDAVARPELGRLLPTEDADAWAMAIVELLADRQDLRAKGEAARAYAAAHCSWRQMGRRYAECLDALV
ncbi:glycosyltransferase family 4 protein [Lysobacter sp. Root690]|uniref:glycosyltransferase family 4 protein n=1 Tax=Lysobacter sp. Root690 TaxID=1736588 RepID=UPI0009E8C6B2|nr:glycosyltransferase family 4 protein [Lysobacter sp. Root690]